MEQSPVIRIWVTNKNNKAITAEMTESIVAFLSIALENGCLGSKFAEDEERVIVYTTWSNEMNLEHFRSSNDYKIHETNIVKSFTAAGFDIPGDILFNSTGKILFDNKSESS